MKVTGKNPAAVMTHAGEPILMRNGTAVTEATGWLLILNRLKGAAFREAWNEMIAEAVCHEVDDLNHCDLLTFSNQSVLGCRKGVKCWKPQVLFPPFTTCARARFRWRLVGAKRINPPQYVSAREAAERLGKSLRELRRLAQTEELHDLRWNDAGDDEYSVDELDSYRRRHRELGGALQARKASQRAIRCWLRNLR